MKQGIAYNQVENSLEAGKSAIREATRTFDGVSPHIVFVFCSVNHDIVDLVRGVRSVFPSTTVVGCTGTGVFSSAGADENMFSLSLQAIHSDMIHFAPFLVGNAVEGPREAGHEIGAQFKSLDSSDGEQLLILLPAGIGVNAQGIFQGIENGYGRFIPCYGGSAGHDYVAEKTFQFMNEDVRSDGIAGVFVHGRFRSHCEVGHGTESIGPAKRVTRAESNRIYEIDGHPVIELLREYYGDEIISDFSHTSNLVALGVPFEAKGYSNNLIARAILGVDEAKHAVILGAEIPTGTMVHLTKRNPQKVLDNTRQMGARMRETIPPSLRSIYIYFNCAGRGSYLFSSPTPDVNEMIKALGPGVPFIGFFTFGEIAPVVQKNEFHNFTGVLLGLEEMPR